MAQRIPKGLTPTERLVLALALLLAVAAVGAMGFVLIERMPLLDALYLTLVVISTLGMKTGIDMEMGPGGKIWVMILIITGIASATIALSTIVGMIVEGHVRSILGRRHVNRKIASSTDHIIVCGYGRMGRTLCASLQQRHVPVVVVDNDNNQTLLAEQEGLPYVLGDASEEAVLYDAGIERAKSLVTVLPTDAENVFVTLGARGLNEKLLIAARAEKAESESCLIRAGANRVICPPIIGAKQLANIITRPAVMDFIDFASEGLELEAEQYRITPECKLVGQSLRQANLPSCVGVLVVALKRSDGQTIFNPGPDTVFQVDDVMISIGPTGSLAQLDKKFT